MKNEQPVYFLMLVSKRQLQQNTAYLAYTTNRASIYKDFTQQCRQKVSTVYLHWRDHLALQHMALLINHFIARGN